MIAEKRKLFFSFFLVEHNDAGMFVYWALQGDKETGRGLPGRVFALEPLQQSHGAQPEAP